ncbi:MAG: peptidoglycan-binding domain-containing protein, partial [Myxococcota bacterium]
EPRVFKNLQTRREHELVVHLPIPRLRLVLLRASGVPYAGLQCLVLFDDEALRPTTDEHGCVEFDIDPSTTLVTISFDLEALEIGVAHLQPVDVLAGCCARLENLGYRPGGCHGDAPADPYALRSAVEEFQCNQGLPVDGELSDATRAKLLDVHGA